MKKLLFILLLSGSMFAQEHVFNVQQYCIDEKPFKKGQCDISGNEYSFVFLDNKKKEVVFFLTDTKMEYKIVSSNVSEINPDYTHYLLAGKDGNAEMKVNRQKTKMEFLYPNNHIYLKVGASTKMQ